MSTSLMSINYFPFKINIFFTLEYKYLEMNIKMP